MKASAFYPIAKLLHPTPEPEEVFLRLCRMPHCLFLDSALRDPKLGRFSFVTADPYDVLMLPPKSADGLGELARRMQGATAATLDGLPPFQGGAAGLFGYDLGRQLETIPDPAIDEFGAPAIALGFYDVVVAFDHADGRAWIVSQGLPELHPGRRKRRAHERLERFEAQLAERPDDDPTPPSEASPPAVPRDQLCREHAVDGHARLLSNFSEQGYLEAVARAIEYIHAGDLFQVNLAQRLLYPAHDDSVALYLRLRHRNPAPFAGFFDLGDFQIVSASPERFLNVVGQSVEARPIKGTRPRTAEPEADRSAGDALRRSEKDRAENVMIVDLLRNDLSRVCRPESVCVTQLCGLETYPYVQHLVSAVCGTLAQGYSPLDLVRAAFPGGSITGAPKVRAMEIIAELEPTARGPYCGSLGYLGCNGALDLNILIRTITAGRGWWQAPVGGGIVAQSVPRREYQETWTKAAGLLRALE